MDIWEQLVWWKEFFLHHPLFTIAMLLLAGFLIGKLADKIGLPEITGFIIAGLLLGGSFAGMLPHHTQEELTIVTEIALSFIALTIGGEFYITKLKRMGKAVIIITLLQISFSFILVTAGLFIFNLSLPFALLLGAISAATAPAATVAIVQSLRAQGKFVDYLYGVVALDDAGCVVLFGIIFAIVSPMLLPGTSTEGFMMILESFKEIGGSLLLGGICGFAAHIFVRKRHDNEILIIALGILFLSTAISHSAHFSPLLTNMTLGAVLINLSPKNHRIFRILHPLSPPIYALFFVLAGAELNISAFTHPTTLILGGIYILLRAIGKYSGVFMGCKLTGTEAEITNNLGFCMLPQAGVAIGLAQIIKTAPFIPHLAPENLALIEVISNIVLLSVFINELIGPPLSRYAVIKGNKMES